MKTQDQYTGSNAEERAADILDALMSDALPPKLEEEIRVWFADARQRDDKENALHKVFLAHVEEDPEPGREVHESLKEIRKVLGFPEENAAVPDAGAKKGSLPAKPLRRRMLRVAAVVVPFLLLAGTAGILFSKYYSAHKEVREIVASAGDVFQMLYDLPDGSQVWLHGGAEIRHPEEFGDVRSVKLTGKAFFRVAKDGQAPFVVETEALTVTVHGTEFMVDDADGPTATVTLHTGSVEVGADGSNVKLVPGEQLEYNHETRKVKVEEVVLEDWTKPSLNFKTATLEEIFISMEENYGVEFVTSGEMPRMRYSINFAGNRDIDIALDALERLAGNFTYSKRENIVEIKITADKYE